MKLRESIFTKQIETDRNVQTVWCEYAWKMSVNSKGSTLSILFKQRQLFATACDNGTNFNLIMDSHTKAVSSPPVFTASILAYFKEIRSSFNDGVAVSLALDFIVR